METHQASEYMQKFFANLQQVKEELKEYIDSESKDITQLIKIYNKFDKAFKVQQ